MTVVVTATTPEGHQAAFVAQNPPTAGEVERLALLGALPGLRDAEWTVAPGTSSR